MHTFVRLLLIPIAAAIIISPAKSPADDMMVFTANQEFLSRIYVMDTAGTVIDYHEYDFYRWVGMEVVDGDLYIAEAFAPRVYKVDPLTGDLEVFIDDWSLFSFYDVAFDGTYFYVDEWDLNRYDINGDYAGTAGFDEDVLGMAWDGQYLWTLDDTDLVKCWDLSGWPTVTQVPDNNFTPPSPQCRGLYFDGEYFWSAESGAIPGMIYKFDYSGKMIEQWSEPAFSGWGAAWIADPLTGVERRNVSSGNVYSLRCNHPNPFNPLTTLPYELGGFGRVSIRVYDVNGRLLRNLIDEVKPAGQYKATWDGSNDNGITVSSGVYFFKMETGRFTAVRKAVFLK